MNASQILKKQMPKNLFVKPGLLLSWLLVSLVTAAFGEENDSSLDEIISQIRAHTGSVKSYRANYKYRETRLPVEQVCNAELSVETTGTCLVDRETGRFRDDRARGYSFNDTENMWQFRNIKEGSYTHNDIRMDISWLDTPEGLDHSPGAVLRRPHENRGGNYNSYNNYGVERYFSKIAGWPLDEHLENVRDNITEIKKIDDYRYEIVWTGADEKAGFSEVYIIDSRLGWNMTSFRASNPSEESLIEQIMEYTSVDGIPFLKAASIKNYYDVTDPSKLTGTVDIEVNIDSVEINCELEEKDFFIDFPPGTRVNDTIAKVHYIIPTYGESHYDVDIGSEPAVAMLGDGFTLETGKQGDLPHERDSMATPEGVAATEHVAVERPTVDTVPGKPVSVVDRLAFWPYATVAVLFAVSVGLGLLYRKGGNQKG